MTLPLVLIVAVVLGGGVYWVLNSAVPQNDVAGNNAATLPGSREGNAKAETETERVRRMLLGVWQDEYQGKRTMTLKEDGSGTMLVELSGIQSILFASKLRFDINWSLERNKLRKKTVSGEPADKVQLILNALGDEAEDTLLEITEDRLLLLDQDGTKHYEWKRVTDP